jgi:hypothetical protein
MKLFHFFIPFAFLPVSTFSQVNFEGIVTYQTFSDMNKDSIAIEIMYGKTKMKTTGWKIKEKQEREYFDNYRVYDFANGTLTEVRPGEKRASIDSINVSDGVDVFIHRTAENKRIGSYPAVKYVVKPNKNGEDSLAFMQTELWFSDEIYYIIPEKYRKITRLNVTETGNILYLENTWILSLGNLLGDTSTKKTTIVTRVGKIEPATLNDTLFAVPAFCKIVAEKIPNPNTTIKLTEIKINKESIESIPPPPPLKTPKTKDW